jgi:hypothetical protein
LMTLHFDLSGLLDFFYMIASQLMLWLRTLHFEIVAFLW